MIPIIRPDVMFDDVADGLKEVLDSGTLTNGPKVREFEQAFAKKLGVAHAVATTSATTALHLALAAHDIGLGDEVLVADFSYPATGNAVAQTGAQPVFVDCLPDRFDMAVNDARAKLTSRTKCLIWVDPFGQPAERSSLMAFAREHKLVMIEDAACAVGATDNGLYCGAFPGVVGCFSFHPRKILTTGEGGMITTDNTDLAERLCCLRNHGAVPTQGGMSFVANGFNYRMNEMQAVLGLAQLSRLDEIVADRRRTAAKMRARLETRLPEVDIPLSSDPTACTFQSFVVLLPPAINRDAVIAHLKCAGIETTLGTYAMHTQPAFAKWGYAPGQLPQAFDRQNRSLTLPLLPRMADRQIDQVVEGLAHALETHGMPGSEASN